MKQSARTYRAILNFGSAILFTAVTTLVGLIATPWLLRWMGEERFGAFRVMTDWYGYLSLFELGLGGALLPLLARALGQGSALDLYDTLAAGVRAYLKVTAAAMAVGLGAGVVITRLVPVSPHLAADLRTAWLVSLLGLLPLCLAPFRALLEARQQDYRSRLLLICQSLLTTGLSLFLAWAGWGITGLALSIVLGSWAFHLIVAGLEITRIPPPRALFRSRPSTSEAGRALWRLSTPTFVLDVGGRIGLLTDNIIVGLVLGPALVTPLVLTQRLISLAYGQLLAVGNASWAGLAELHVRGERQLFNQRLIELTRIVALLGVASLAPIMAFSQHFVTLWVGADYYVGDWLVAVAALNALFQAILSLWGWCFGGTGQVHRTVRPYLLATVVNLTTSVLLTLRLGLVGPLLGTLVASVTIEIWYLPILLRQVFGTCLTALARAALVPVIWGVPYTASLSWIARTHGPTGWWSLAVSIGSATLFFLIVTGYFILTSAERALWRSRIAALWLRFYSLPR